MKNIVENLKKYALETIQVEARAVDALPEIVDEGFGKAVEVMAMCKGRIVVSGVGKSAIIAQKMVATLNSTGTCALFMHSADAVHGDMGMVGGDDVVLFISKSGDTDEIKRLLPFIKKMGNPVISIVSKRDSYLGTHSDYLIYVPMEREACPNNLAPTTSTTLHLVVCDAIAMALSRYRNFTPEDFGRFHPGGSLGKRLYMRVEDVFDKTNKPWVSEDETIKNAIITISSHRLGATVVLGPDGSLKGIITDGDVRRMIENGKDINTLRAGDIMSRSPKTIDLSALAVDALRLMEANKITSVVVLSEGKYAGLIHIHDIMREGIQ
ncbi:MAG TPA: KpsF/GutQ family sugar-phosphate isomerase [Candidatus Coprenecus stercoravium]|uniref:KpsF/GutQ family sugar-phosphate isomerase n=1 Tax=Candidatus Coprenecus stercoravium TaxID=2840735 RepID=A0A9D2GQD5_9BACT|nr:KpsF/GutQ family sugar-phosphate isomerase [Candidatus Coprenecus stercoravium]